MVRLKATEVPQVPQVPQPNAALQKPSLWRAQAKNEEKSQSAAAFSTSEETLTPKCRGTSDVLASTGLKLPQISAAQVPQTCGTSRPIPDTTPVLRARQRFVTAMDAGDRDNALHRLTREYLPALRVIAEGCDQETLGAEIDRLDGRLLRGIDYEGPNAERWYSLLAQYETLCDAAAMRHVGTALHPTVYLVDRVEQRCRR